MAGTTQQPTPEDGLDCFLRIGRIRQVTDSSKSTILRWVKAGKFPAPVFRDGQVVLWSRNQVMEWQQQAKAAK